MPSKGARNVLSACSGESGGAWLKGLAVKQREASSKGAAKAFWAQSRGAQTAIMLWSGPEEPVEAEVAMKVMMNKSPWVSML
jgi:hypothetical protein